MTLWAFLQVIPMLILDVFLKRFKFRLTPIIPSLVEGFGVFRGITFSKPPVQEFVVKNMVTPKEVSVLMINPHKTIP